MTELIWEGKCDKENRKVAPLQVRLRSIAEDITTHFTEHVVPNGYKAQVVCFTRRACVEIKNHLDELLGPDVSDIIYTGAQNDDDELRKYHYSSEKQKEVISDFKNSEHAAHRV